MGEMARELYRLGMISLADLEEQERKEASQKPDASKDWEKKLLDLKRCRSLKDLEARARRLLEQDSSQSTIGQIVQSAQRFCREPGFANLMNKVYAVRDGFRRSPLREHLEIVRRCFNRR